MEYVVKPHSGFEDAKRMVLEASWDGEEALEPISFTTSDPEYGWIDAELTLGYRAALPIALPDAYPPFQAMLAWLERLVAGASSAVLYIYDENDDHYFSVTRLGVNDQCLDPHSDDIIELDLSAVRDFIARNQAGSADRSGAQRNQS